MSGATNTRESCSWGGVPLCDIYGSQSPWEVPEFPFISPAYNHAVLFEVKDDQAGKPPKPHQGHDKWDSDHVRMPCSSQSLYPVQGENGQTLKKRWEIIEQALSKPIKCSEDLAATILSYNTKFISIWKFSALHKLFNEYLEEEESMYFFNVTITEIAKLALALPKLIQSPIPLLKQHKNRAVSLSQQQIACLLANAFFCTFPRRNTSKRGSEYALYPNINFNSLFESIGSDAVMEKLKCIFHYFRRVCTKVPIGVMTFLRHTVPPQECPQWSKSTKFVGGIPLHVDSEGTIEEADGLIQVDFANKFLGGGVLRRGCVQEEIRFVICPELMLSMLFTEVLDSTEALLMLGCERYSTYTGYGNTFKWAGDYNDCTPFDSSLRRKCAILAIDAYPFRKKITQYEPAAIVRELNKAWVGFSVGRWRREGREGCVGCGAGVASGNWGCGAFGGNAHLKSLLQLMAGAETGRALLYYTFGDAALRDDLVNMYNLLSRYNVTVGQLFEYIIQFTPSKCKKSEAELHTFLHQLILDKAGVSKEKKTKEEFVFPWTNKELSPDLFEEGDDDMLIDSTILFEKNALDMDVSVSSNASVTLKEDNKTMNKSNLFYEMTNFDDENGKLNLNSDNKSILHNLNEDRNVSAVHNSRVSGDIDQNSQGVSGNMDQSAERVKRGDSSQLCHKRKVGKKITDYFNKKPT